MSIMTSQKKQKKNREADFNNYDLFDSDSSSIRFIESDAKAKKNRPSVCIDEEKTIIPEE